MGLDNGLIVRCKNAEKFFNSLPSYVHVTEYVNHNTKEYEVGYWRKCWGLRKEINSAVHMKMDQYERKLNKDDIPEVLDVIKRYLNPEYWDANADSIWSWDDYFEHNLQQYINLQYIYEVWDEYEPELIWYDSY